MPCPGWANFDHFRLISSLPTLTLLYPPQSGERVLLPVLTRLNFRGQSEYLERFVDRIDAPRLGEIEVIFFNTPLFNLSNLSKFINRIEMHKSHNQARILSSERAISISLIQPGTPMRLELQLLCEPLSVQLVYMAEICIHLSAFLLNVGDLRISTTRPSTRGDKLPSGRWLESISSFTGVRSFHIEGNLSTDIVGALQLPDAPGETVLPTLHKICLLHPGPCHAPLGETVVSLITSRRFSGHS